MKRPIVIALWSLMLSACIVVPGRRGPEVVAVPPLPQVVELLDDAFYFQSNYWYDYNGGDWRYGHSRNGPWVALPRDRYPREVRFKNRGRDEGRGREERRDRGHRDR